MPTDTRTIAQMGEFARVLAKLEALEEKAAEAAESRRTESEKLAAHMQATTTAIGDLSSKVERFSESHNDLRELVKEQGREIAELKSDGRALRAQLRVVVWLGGPIVTGIGATVVSLLFGSGGGSGG